LTLAKLLFLPSNWLIVNPESAIIGRKKELLRLDNIVQSKKSEFLTVYERIILAYPEDFQFSPSTRA
jgi:hypothetical protein